MWDDKDIQLFSYYIEKGFVLVFLLLNFFCVFVKNQVIILSGFWTFYSVPLTCLSILMPVTHLIPISLQYVLKYGTVNSSLFLFIFLFLFLLFFLLLPQIVLAIWIFCIFYKFYNQVVTKNSSKQVWKSKTKTKGFWQRLALNQ